jgi:outer membrane protein assembly factor BamB
MPTLSQSSREDRGHGGIAKGSVKPAPRLPSKQPIFLFPHIYPRSPSKCDLRLSAKWIVDFKKGMMMSTADFVARLNPSHTSTSLGSWLSSRTSSLGKRLAFNSACADDGCFRHIFGAARSTVSRTSRALARPVLALLLLAGICLAQPAVTLSPTSGPPTSTVQVSGSGFTPNAKIKIFFDVKDEALAVANGSGSFSNVDVIVPAKAVPGTHWISAVQPASHTGAQAPFLVQTNWSQLGFDANHDQWNPFENQLNTKTVKNLVVDWTYPAAGMPSLVGETLFFGSGNTAYAINAANGSLVWQYTTGGQIPNGSPAVANGIVYLGSGDYSVYALNAADGSLAWHYSTGSYVVSQPVVANGIVYVASDDNTVYALQGGNGTLLWKYTTGAPISFAPAVADGMVYVASSDGNIYALNASSGSVVWQFATTAQYNGSTPSVVNGVLYMASADGNLYALNAGNGSLLWKTFFGNAPADGCTAAVADGTVYLGSGDAGVFYAIDALSGKVRWKYTTTVPVYAASAVADGVVYFGSGDQNFYALNATSGKLLWRYTTAAYFPPGIVVNAKVYLAGSTLYALGLPGQNVDAGAASKPPDISTLGSK